MDHILFMCSSTSLELCKVGGLPARPLPQGPERARHPEVGDFLVQPNGADLQGRKATAAPARVGSASDGHEVIQHEQPRRPPAGTARRRRTSEEPRMVGTFMRSRDWGLVSASYGSSCASACRFGARSRCLSVLRTEEPGRAASEARLRRAPIARGVGPSAKLLGAPG